MDAKWPTIQTFGKVISYRVHKGEGKLQTRYYISSAILSAEELAYADRGHWVLDVTMNEDACQISRGDSAENLARMRQATTNILKNEQSKAKQSKAKQSKAKQSKAKQSKAKQSKAKQSKAKQSKAKQSKAKQIKSTPQETSSRNKFSVFGLDNKGLKSILDAYPDKSMGAEMVTSVAASKCAMI
ncbi:hypothetical protein L5L95_23680 [Shewanella sp. SM35]|nr:hypothetical protein [Shewanella sp. SM35]